MRKIFPFLILLFLAGVLRAQTQAGSVLLGTSASAGSGLFFFPGLNLGANQASVGLGTDNVDGDRIGSSTIITLAPQAGYFVTNGLMIGLNMSVLIVRIKEEGDNESDGGSITSFQPMIRYYFKPAGKIRPFGEVRGGFLSYKDKNDDDEGETVTLFGAKGGAAFFLNDKVSLDLFLDYGVATNKEGSGNFESKSTNSLISFGAGFSIFL
jgi:outer membrane protein